MTKNRRWLISLCLVALGCAIVAASALASSGGKNSPGSRRSSSVAGSHAHALAARAGVSQSLIKHFAVLRKARSAADGAHALPIPFANRLIAAPDTAGYALDPASAQYVATGAHGVWVIPGGAGICLAQPLTMQSGVLIEGAFSLNCNTIRNADAGLLRGTETDQTGALVEGLAPDGTTPAVANGASPVSDVGNVYTVRDVPAASVHLIATR
jgi:hypothetical protein